MTVVMGIDPSMSSTGLAIWRDGVVTVQTVATTPARHATTPNERLDDRLARQRHIVAEVYRASGPTYTADAEPCALAIVEDVVPGAFKGGDTAKQLAGLHNLMLYGLYMRGVALVLVQPAQLKQFAVGKGSGPGTDKLAMVRAADKRLAGAVWPTDGSGDSPISNDNEADALWLLAMALHHYRRPLVDMPAKHTAALDKVAWRPFTLPPKED